MRFIKADKIFSGKHFLEENNILVLDDENRFVEFVPAAEIENSQVEIHDGILCPGFVNTHCHLELSHLFNKINTSLGLPGFAFEVVRRRNSFAEEEKALTMREADLQMRKNGIVVVGDISNDIHSAEIKTKSPIHYHTFVELIGLNPAHATEIFSRGILLQKEFISHHQPASLSAHAPYSVSVPLMKLIFDFNDRNAQTSCIHHEESAEEEKFLSGKENLFTELYHKLKLDLSWYKSPDKRSAGLYENISPHHPLILVHNTFTRAEDLQRLCDKNIFYCFCPNANLFIENTLPDFNLFKNSCERICLGTDSLASNSELNILSEANKIMERSRTFSIENILQAITLNGAAALGLSDSFGTFIKGKNAGLNLISIENNRITLQKKLA